MRNGGRTPQLAVFVVVVPKCARRCAQEPGQRRINVLGLAKPQPDLEGAQYGDLRQRGTALSEMVRIAKDARSVIADGVERFRKKNADVMKRACLASVAATSLMSCVSTNATVP